MLTGRFPFTFRKFEGNIHEKNNYQNQSCRYLYTGANFPKIHSSNLLSNQTVINKNSIPKVIFKINAKNSYEFLGRLIFGPIKALANQAAEILIQSPDKALKYGLNCFFFTKIILTFFDQANLRINFR